MLGATAAALVSAVVLGAPPPEVTEGAHGRKLSTSVRASTGVGLATGGERVRFSIAGTLFPWDGFGLGLEASALSWLGGDRCTVETSEDPAILERRSCFSRSGDPTPSWVILAHAGYRIELGSWHRLLVSAGIGLSPAYAHWVDYTCTESEFETSCTNIYETRAAPAFGASAAWLFRLGHFEIGPSVDTGWIAASQGPFFGAFGATAGVAF